MPSKRGRRGNWEDDLQYSYAQPRLYSRKNRRKEPQNVQPYHCRSGPLDNAPMCVYVIAGGYVVFSLNQVFSVPDTI